MVTLSSVVPMLVKIEGLCRSTTEADGVVESIKKRVWAYISAKFDSTNDESLQSLITDFSAATMLDRRYSYRFVQNKILTDNAWGEYPSTSLNLTFVFNVEISINS